MKITKNNKNSNNQARNKPWPPSAGLAGAFLAVSFVLLPTSVTAGQTKPAKADDPHWQPRSCAQCHTIKNDKVLAIAPQQVDQLCLDCHDGKKGKAEPHPIGRILAGDEFVKPQGWPLLDGKLTCLTCHDVKLGCSHSVQRPLLNTVFLRGSGVGAPEVFCQNCHKTELYKKYNPHIMLDSNGTARQGLCLFCHTKEQDRTTKLRTGKPALRSMELRQCRACHAFHVDYFQPGHVDAKIPPEMLAYIAARELVGPTTRPSAELVKQLESAGTRANRMMPNRQGKIVCTTCHNPHQEGLFSPDSVLAYAAMRVIGPDKIVSPVRGQKFCLRCHNK